MAFEDIIERNRKHAGWKHQLPPAPLPLPAMEPIAEQNRAVARRCPTCAGNVEALGVQRMRATGVKLSFTYYSCKSCVQTFNIPSPITVVMSALVSVLFLAIAVMALAGVVVKTDEPTAIAAVLGGLGAALLTWTLRAHRRERTTRQP